MLLGGICFLIGAVLTSTAFALPQLVIGRVVLGFGVGAHRAAAPCWHTCLHASMSQHRKSSLQCSLAPCTETLPGPQKVRR
jgi:MFS family permease